MRSAKSPSRAGEVLAGKYRLDRRLAIGGMGEVYRGVNLSAQREVAIKLLRRELTHNPDIVRRFLREGKTANRVEHPNIVRVLDVDTDGAQVFIVQDLLDGEDLHKLLKRSGKRLPVAEVLEIVAPVAEALGAAHAAGLVHRDLKPANVFLQQVGPRRIPMVLDFGIAKVITAEHDDDTPLTATGTSLGTPAYMSPEQVMSPRSVDARSDVWALGILLHRAIAGALPFSSDSPGGLMVTICTKAPTPLDVAVPDVPAEVAEVVAGCLARDPDARFADGKAVGRALRGAIETLNETISGVTAKTGAASSAPPRPSLMPDLELDLSAHRSAPPPQSTRQPVSAPRPGTAASERPPTSDSPPTSHARPMRVPSIRPAVTRHSTRPPPGATGPLSGRRPLSHRPPSLEPPAPQDHLPITPVVLGLVAMLPALILGWSFDSPQGVASLAARIGGAGIGVLCVATGLAAARVALLLRDDEKVAIVATVGLAGTTLTGLLASVASFGGEAPAPWINTYGAIAAAVATSGVAAIGLARAHTCLTAKPSLRTVGVGYLVPSVIALGAALRLAL